MEELLAKTIEAAVSLKALAPKDLERVIVDSMVQEKAIAFPTDSRLLDVARRKLVLIARRAGVVLRETFEKERRSLKRRAGGYAHARQYRRLHRVLKRQRTILGRVLRDLEHRLPRFADGMSWLLRAIARLGLKALLALWLLVGMLWRAVSNEGSRPPDRRLEAAK